jgi:general stress protein YciG
MATGKEKRLATLRERYGPEWFKTIGAKGAQATKDAAIKDPQKFKERGQRGGNTTLRKWGTQHFVKAVKARYEKKEPTE